VGDPGRSVLRGLGSLLRCATLAVCMCSQQAPVKPPAEQGTACRIEGSDFEGWRAQQISNSSLKLIIVPQLGGRVMQVVFDGHPYLCC